MRLHTIIHAPFEKLGTIETWSVKNHHSLTSTHTYRGEKLPAISEFDFLIIMGGPQSPLEIDQYPYLQNEIDLTKLAIANQKSVLGICLGAQIIGTALGAKTERSPNKEVGVFPITLTNEADTDPIFKLFPKQFDVMHWHNDMPGLTNECVLLAKSEGCPRQAIRYGEKVYGLQCHMEMTPELVKGMIEHCAHDLTPSRYTQIPAEMLAADLSSMNLNLWKLLDYLTAISDC